MHDSTTAAEGTTPWSQGGNDPGTLGPYRYDADQTVTAFAARLKDAVDLDAVRGDLAGVMQRILEPAHVSVWISRRGAS